MYDPRAEHAESLGYDDATGRQRVLPAQPHVPRDRRAVGFVPEASMGTAIEMWEAYQHGAAVITISPLRHNWAVKFLSHALYCRPGGVRGRPGKRRNRAVIAEKRTNGRSRA